MLVESISRSSGPAAAAGGLLFAYSMSGIFRNSGAPLWLLLLAALLWAVALIGLYQRLPAASSAGNKAAFSVALVSLLSIASGILAFRLSNPDLPWYLLGIGLFGVAIGITAMGAVALVQRALGVWRYVPLALGCAFLSFLVVNSVPATPQSLTVALLFLTAIGWLLLGVALWQTHAQRQSPGLVS